MEFLGPLSGLWHSDAIIFKRARGAPEAIGQEMNLEAQLRAIEQANIVRGTNAPSAPVQYVDALMSRANRQADTFLRIAPLACDGLARHSFEVARQANEASDYQTAARHFEKAYLLYPKLDTLLSAANMHLKLGNQGI